ncbi:ankyrin [Mollisia scopiformis]|uniref:Ankyrin n=1 Tax=Mollisia scopiformis TaxID=149040 RepID=A0A194XC14_MOLSC|nr:ankyrin [Mollisia scopiformis]KUJ17713.1 ankyrin [Mollisia scopiformis]
MGCCCCCVSGRKPRRESIIPQDQESIGPPPPYDAKDIHESENVVTAPVEKLPTPTYQARTGIRSQDMRLYQAAAGGHLESVKSLLAKGVNPSDRTVCDWCPLHWAAHNDLEDGFEIVKLLVEHGADVNQVSDTGLTPLDLATRAEKTEIVQYLKEKGAMSGAVCGEINRVRSRGKPRRIVRGSDVASSSC